MTLADIDTVLTRLDEIIDTTIRDQDRIGYFAAMYRSVTQAVRDAIVDDKFDDSERMARFDFLFADRFIDAYDTQQAGRQPTKSWELAFDAAGSRWLIIVQQLLLGMNAHINLDLGIAAAHVVREEADSADGAHRDQAMAAALASLKHDFDRIDQVLGGLVPGFESTVGALSPRFGWLERLGGRTEDQLVKWSITKAREAAWLLATELSGPDANEARIIHERDEITSLLGKGIRRPGILLPVKLLIIRSGETHSVSDVIDRLRR